MAAWWDQLSTGMGDALIGMQNPFGFAPPEGFDRQQAIRSGALSLGTNIMANSRANPVEAVGQAYNQARQDAGEQSKQAFMAQQMMMDAEEKKKERARQQQEQQWLEGEISKLPVEQQGMARMMPDKFFGEMIQSQFPDANGTDSEVYGTVYFDEKTQQPYVLTKQGRMKAPEGLPVGAKIYDPYTMAREKAAGSKEGAAIGEARGDLPGAVVQADVTSMKIQKLIEDPNLDSAVGYASWAPDLVVPNSVISVRGKIDELMGGAFLEARQMLKGGGQITDYEGQRAERAYTRMEKAIKSSDPAEFKSALADFNQAINDGVRKLAATARQPVPGAGGGQGSGTTSGGVPWSIE